jgi:CheY-like chemotaxis protein/HPt (histidine-containing phosphotransfer) domain-containing protein
LLLAEDNAINQLVARSMLEAAGHRVVIAANGAEAVARCAKEPFDCVLMDCRMPVMDGLEATRRIREMEGAAGRRTPIIALTANAMQGDRERCLAAGMDGFLAKPLDRRTLLDTVASADSATALADAASRAPPAPANAASVAPFFDTTALDELILMDGESPGLMKRLVGTFLETTPGLLTRVESGTEGPDLAIAAHSLKSTFARFGAMRLSQLAASAESAARRGDLGGARAAGIAIRDGYAEFLREFRAHPAVAQSLA